MFSMIVSAVKHFFLKPSLTSTPALPNQYTTPTNSGVTPKASLVETLNPEYNVVHLEHLQGEDATCYFTKDMVHKDCDGCKSGTCVQKVVRWRGRDPVVLHCAECELN